MPLNFKIERNPSDTKIHLRHVNDADDPVVYATTRTLAAGVTHAACIAEVHAHLSSEGRTGYMVESGACDLERDVAPGGTMGWEASDGVEGDWTRSTATKDDVISHETHLPSEPRAEFARDTWWFQPEVGITDADFAGAYVALDIADGEEIIIAFTAGSSLDADGNNDYWAGIALGDSTDGFDDGDFNMYYWDGALSGMSTWNSGTGYSSGVPSPAGGDMYLRIRRIDVAEVGHLYIDCSSSPRGNWAVLGDEPLVGADYLWFFCRVERIGNVGDSIKHRISPSGLRWMRQRPHSGL